MAPRSIRWRLPLGYAGIALLAVLSLGLVLLLTLRSYYLGQESDYLRSRAEAIGPQLSPLLSAGAPTGILQSLVESTALLYQARVKLIGTDGATLADSGNPTDLDGLASFSIGVDVPGLSQAVTQTVDGADGLRKYTSLTAIEGAGDSETVGRIRVKESVSVTGADGSPASITGLPGDQSLPIVPIVGPEFGFLSGENADAPRSGKTVRSPVYGELGRVQGFLELSDGPAFGREVLGSVARGWALAGGVAVALAATVGWLMSLRLTGPLLGLTETTSRMSRGDLSVRTGIRRSDELGQLSSAFDGMAERIETTVLTLRRFVADAAHQLLTPLTALRTNLDVMDGADDADDRRAMVRNARLQVDRLEGLCNGLLDLSRLEAEAGDVQYSPTDLKILLGESSELFASRAEQAGLTFTLGPPVEDVTVRANDDQVRQAVGNLLDNAIKFTPPEGEVAVTLKREGRWAVLVVEDTGIGVPGDDAPHLFERFHRGRNSSSYPGNGLGLTIVASIAESHGGRITAEPQEPGSRFSLWLPVDGP